MFRFQHTEFLWALLIVPLFVLIFIFLLNWRKRSIRTCGDRALIMRLMPDVSTGKPVFKFVLFTLAYIFLILGLANPQIGTKLEEVKREGVDIIIALDVSNSMLAEDLSPNRLERAKRAIEQLVDKLHNDRIGIIVFGGQAYTQLPVTTDYAAAKLFLSTISTDLIPTQGTAIGAAISLAMESFDFKNNSGKAIVIITDGEDHEGDIAEEIKAANEKQVVIHTIGMGSSQGAPIPIYRQGQQVGFKKDREGNTVVTKLNEDMLAQIAASGNGTYVRASNAESGLNIILDKINKMQKAEFGTKIYTDYEDRFQYFIAISFLLLLLEFIVSERKSKWLSSIRLFEVKK
jgi:Ca-activated chloride channel homolog